jgi:hypothetical protein
MTSATDRGSVSKNRCFNGWLTNSHLFREALFSLRLVPQNCVLSEFIICHGHLGFIRVPKAASASGYAFIAPFGRLLLSPHTRDKRMNKDSGCFSKNMHTNQHLSFTSEPSRCRYNWCNIRWHASLPSQILSGLVTCSFVLKR